MIVYTFLSYIISFIWKERYLVPIVGEVGKHEIEEGEQQQRLIGISSESEINFDALSEDLLTGKRNDPIEVIQ
jgi:hypothetical protein